MNYTAAYEALHDLLERDPGKIGEIWDSARINGADTCIEADGGDRDREAEYTICTFFELLDGAGLHSDYDKYIAIAKAA